MAFYALKSWGAARRHFNMSYQGGAGGFNVRHSDGRMTGASTRTVV